MNGSHNTYQWPQSIKIKDMLLRDTLFNLPLSFTPSTIYCVGVCKGTALKVDMTTVRHNADRVTGLGRSGNRTNRNWRQPGCCWLAVMVITRHPVNVWTKLSLSFNTTVKETDNQHLARRRRHRFSSTLTLAETHYANAPAPGIHFATTATFHGFD